MEICLCKLLFSVPLRGRAVATNSGPSLFSGSMVLQIKRFSQSLSSIDSSDLPDVCWDGGMAEGVGKRAKLFFSALEMRNMLSMSGPGGLLIATLLSCFGYKGPWSGKLTEVFQNTCS